MLKIFADDNESSSQRPANLANALESFKGKIEWGGYDSLPVDYVVTDGQNRVLIEAKEISDFWSSKGTGHLGQQIMVMVQEGAPGFVAVFGSMQEVMAGVPTVTMKDGRVKGRSRQDIASDCNTARAMSADAAACGVPVFFLSSNHEQSFKWILSYSKHILTGPCMASWLPRYPVEPLGYSMLCSIPGIGDVAAKGLLEAFGSIYEVLRVADIVNEFGQSALEVCKINGKALGKAKAAKIRAAFMGGEA